jgi:hypothetical protein
MLMRYSWQAFVALGLATGSRTSGASPPLAQLGRAESWLQGLQYLKR